MKLESLQIYQLAMDIGETVWQAVEQWNYFAKDTVGKQLVRAADSIAVNISEGFGRYHFKEARQFSYYARGSLFETKTWHYKAHNRNLIADTVFHQLQSELETLSIKLNKYIKSIGKAQKH